MAQTTRAPEAMNLGWLHRGWGVFSATRAHLAARTVGVLLAALGIVAVLQGAARASVSTPHGFSLDVWTMEDGLPGNTVTSVVQTRDGYLWVATFNGLARFDGIRFTAFQASRTPGMTTDRLLCLLEDRSGALWIGTEGGGLLRYADGEFTSLTTREGLAHNLVFALDEDADGNLWIGTLGGLNRLHQGRLEVLPGMTEAMPTPDLGLVFADPDGTVWLTQQRAIARWRDGQFHPLTIDDIATAPDLRRIVDPDGYTWLRLNGGVLRISDAGQAALFHDGPSGSAWAWNNTGLVRLQGDSTETHPLPAGLALREIRNLYEDHEGSVWVGTWAKGLARLRPRRVGSISEATGLTHDVVMSLREDDDGSLWVALNCGGVNLVRDGVVTSFAPAGDRCVWSLRSTRSGDLWMGTWGDGVLRYSGGELSAFDTTRGFVDDIVLSLYEDARGSLWIGTYDQGVCEYRDGRFTQHAARDGLTGKFISAFAEGPEGDLWVGSNGGGLFRRTPAGWVHYSRASGLIDEAIRTLYLGSDQRLWIGTGRGLGVWDGRQFHRLDADQGLLSDVVYQILEDDFGHLWLGTHDGILRVPLEQLHDVLAGRRRGVDPLHLGLADGLATLECTGAFTPAGLKGRDGRLYFSSVKGVVVVDPATLRLNARPPPVSIEGLFVDADERPSLPRRASPDGTPSDMVHHQAIAGSEVRLPPGRQRLEIHYTALSLLDPRKVRFRYQLTGFDRGWIDAGSRRIAYYTNLRPGHYRFRVIACNNDGVWNEEGASLAFHLAPRFHQTAIFPSLCAVTALAALAAVIQLRLRFLQRRQRLLEATVAERTHALRAEILERERAEEDARAARDAAETANRAKSLFLAQMSHELRTPMNGVIGMSRLLLETPLSPEQRDLAGTVQTSAESLLAILNDILDFSKIEAGKLILERLPIDLRPTLEGTLDVVAERAAEKGLELNLLLDPDVPATVHGDPGRLRQVLLNLLSNAVKFTDHGEISLRVSTVQTTPIDVEIRFEVADTGVGIAPAAQKRLFHAFEQGDNSITRKYGGTGLGLAICRRLVSLMRGEIHLTSRPGAGSTFWFTARFGRPLPLPSDPSTHAQVRFPGVRALIAEDNATQRTLLAGHLEAWGMASVVQVPGTEPVLDRLREATAAGRPFHVVLLDQTMPGMDGHHLVRDLRSDPSLAGLRLLLLAPRIPPPAAPDRSPPHLDGIVTKPIRRDALARALREALNPHPETVGSADSRATTDSPSPPFRRLKVLLVEDNVVNQMVARRQLEKLGYTADLVTDGRAAVETLEKTAYDVVLMDCHMPEMDGYEATRRIRLLEASTTASAGRPRTRIIAMTADAMPGDREACLQAGMDAYISKPVELDHLRRLLECAEQERAPIPA